MTLISCTLNNGAPIILGDLLVSSRNKGANINLPAFLDGVDKYLPDGLDGYPEMLIQKTYIIKDNLVVATSGNYCECLDFIKDLREFFRTRHCVKETIEEFLKTNGNKSTKKSTYLMVHVKKVGQEHSFFVDSIGGGCLGIDGNRVFDKVRAIGTGSADFIKEVNRFSEGTGIGDINENNQAIAANLVLLSSILAREAFSLETIKKCWGAGFEMVYYDFMTEKFTKMDELTYVIWHGNLDLNTKEFKILPYLLLSYKYFGDLLLLNSCDFKQIRGMVIRPIFIEKKDVDTSIFPSQPTFYNTDICNTFFLTLSDGTIETPSMFVHNGPDLGKVFIEILPSGQIGVNIEEELARTLINGLINYRKRAG